MLYIYTINNNNRVVFRVSKNATVHVVIDCSMTCYDSVLQHLFSPGKAEEREEKWALYGFLSRAFNYQ